MKIIGRVEQVSLPELEMSDIAAKIDTGAYSSALHCHKIQIKQEEDKEVLYFNLLDPSHEVYSKKPIRFETFSQTTVKSSNGKRQKRFKIKTKIKLGTKIYKTEFTLTDRRDMRYPILLGRKLLDKKFLVDVSQKFILKKQS
ncbi:MAG: ATP-dependent zinc protease [Bernardetiaceae bacterium]|nr:ATP-dependent zinc protease [Bernardetiaceae bacterium]